jgi:hypothetical protein
MGKAICGNKNFKPIVMPGYFVAGVFSAGAACFLLFGCVFQRL